MFSDVLTGIIKRTGFTYKMIWGSMFFTNIFYLLVLIILKQQFTGREPISASLLFLLLFMAAGAAFLSYYLDNFFLSHVKISPIFDLDFDLDEYLKRNKMFASRMAGAHMPSLEDEEQRFLVLLMKYYQIYLFKSALAEYIAIIGFFLVILSKSLIYFFPFAGAAMLLQLLYFPNGEKFLKNRVERYL